jgi:hypothetical protein
VFEVRGTNQTTGIYGTAGVDVTDIVNIIDIPVVADSDDAEEYSSGAMYLNSSDLEMTFDAGGNQTVGMRFNDVIIPADATITNAYIQFTVDETSSGTTNLTIHGEASNNASNFTPSIGDISGRPLTGATVGWTPAPWPTVGEADIAQQTSNIASIIKEIVGSANGWASGNSLVIIISGSGERTAESYDGVASAAPVLHVEYTP